MTKFIVSSGRLIDKYIFKPLCNILSVFKVNKELNKSKIKKILVVKLWALGDSIVLLPTLVALKKQFPKAELHVLSHPRNKVVFEGQPFIDQVIDFGLINILKLFRKYDVCIDSEPALNVSAVISFFASKHTIGFDHGARAKLYSQTSEFNKKRHMVQNYLDLARKIGVKYDTDKLIPLITLQSDKDFVSTFLKNHHISKKDFVVGIAPGVAESVKFRMWPLKKLAELSDILIKVHKAKIIFIGTKADKSLVGEITSNMTGKTIDATGQTSVKQAAELTRNCNIVISNDSGTMHISAAMGTKTIGLFGPNTPLLWAPYGRNNTFVFKPKKGCPFMDNKNPELTPTHLTKDQETCMDAISVNDVLDAVKGLK
ncbi:MAG: glycosyltransferase family 9 protein [Nanoarchaeota archaeon]